MNVSKNKFDLGGYEAQLIENMEFDVEGQKLSTRRGLGAPIYTFESDILYIWNDYELNLFLVFLKNKNIYKYEYGKTATLIGQLNGSADTHPCVARYGTKVLIASGSTLQIYEYSGSTINTDASYPICDMVMERFSRILVSKRGSNNMKYSAIGDPTNWTENTNDLSSSKDIDVGDISGIMGIFPLATDVIVFKENGRIYRVSNEPEDWNITVIGDGSDFLSRNAMANLGDNIVYYSRQGLRSLETSETYGNFTSQEIGEKCNPLLKKSFTNPFMEKLDRSNQIIVSADSGTTMYAYHYDIKAFTKWVFPVPVATISEGKEATLVGAGKSIYNFAYTNDTDITDGVAHNIHQTIISRPIWDSNIITVYRSHIVVDSASAGSALMSVNDVSWTWEWTADVQDKEFKTQIRSNMVTAKFETDSRIVWDYWKMTLVYQYVNVVSQSTNDRGQSGSWSKTKWGQGTFAGTVTSSGGTPYGYV